MTVLRLMVFCLLICGTTGFSYWFNLFNKCNPPQKLLGKICVTLMDNDIDDDGYITNKDIDYDIVLFNFDDKPCSYERWETVVQWTCRYGWSEEYSRYMFHQFNGNSNRALSYADFNRPIRFNHTQFLTIEFNRFTQYCSNAENRRNPVDRVLCAEADTMKLADVRCD